jgi:hypothetical protein
VGLAPTESAAFPRRTPEANVIRATVAEAP